MSDIHDLSEACTQIISPTQALHQLLSPPETHSQIRVVMRAFLPVLQLMPEILAEESDLDMMILRNMLPSIIQLCQAIRDESKEGRSWKSTSEEKPQITPYPTYRALLEIGDKHSLSDEQQRLLAHVFIAIWRGVPGTDDGRVPLSNLQHVFLEYRRPHLWRENLHGVDTSRPNKCYTALKKREETLKVAHDLVFKHIAPIRRLLGLSLRRESIKERDGGKEADEKQDSDETQTADGPELDTAEINIELPVGDGASDESIIGYVTPLVAKDGSDDRALQNAERETLPAIDAVNSVILAAASSGSASRKALGGRHVAAQNHAIANQVKNSAQTLTIQWDRLTEYDLYVLWDEVSEPDDTEFLAALAIQLMLLTGRPLNVVLDTQLKSRVADLPDKTSNDRIYLCRETAIWQARVPLPKRVRPIEPELQQRLIPSVSQVRLPIVASLWNAVTRHTGNGPDAWRGSLFKSLSKETITEQADALLKRIIKTHGARLSEKRVQRALFNRIADGSGDMVEAIVITGNERSSGQHIGIYYHCALESDLQQTYLTAISRMLPEFTEFLAPAMTQRPSEKSGRRIGSPYCPTRHAVKTLVSDLTGHIDDVRRQPITKSTFADIHNAYVLYTVFLMFFSTGYRSVKAPLSRLTDIDLSSRYIVIADKTGDDWGHCRLVPLADVFVSHWQNYLSHRKHVTRLMKTYLGQGDPGHALFFLSTKEKQGIQAQEMIPEQITTHVSPFSNMPLNVSRHYLRSELRHRNLPGSMIDAFMGHWIAGKEPMARFSTLSPTVFRDTLAPVLDEILAETGWVAIRGLGQ